MPNEKAHIEAIESLYRQHGPALLLFAESMTGERSRAQDSLHQVFLRLIEQGPLHDVTDVKAYLFACVRNSILNDIKFRERNVELVEGSAWFEPPNRDYAGELNLRRTLFLLPEDQRQVIVLHVWGELTFAQIATLLEISSNTVASRYRYALSKLRESLGAKEVPCAQP